MPAWIWPQRQRGETTVATRLGRVVHWIGFGIFVVLMLTPVAAATVDSSDPGAFVSSLSVQAFPVLHTGSKVSARGQFRTLLGQYFAIN